MLIPGLGTKSAEATQQTAETKTSENAAPTAVDTPETPANAETQTGSAGGDTAGLDAFAPLKDVAVSYEQVDNALNHDPVIANAEEEEIVEDFGPYKRIDYKHKSIATFEIGTPNAKVEFDGLMIEAHFRFSNHIMTLEGPSQIVDARNKLFLKYYSGLLGVDKVNIKRLRNIENEVTPEIDLTPSSVRGPVGTQRIADRQAGDRLMPQTRPGGGFAARTLPFQNGAAKG